MKKILFIISLFLIACSNSETPKNTIQNKEPKKKVVVKPSTKKQKQQPKKKAKPKNLITNKNVVERLTKFGESNPETIAKIYTTKGTVTIRLFKDTPLHRANFVMMAKKGFYNGSVFTRVAPQFIAQGGGTHKEEQQKIKESIGKYTIPAEFLKHRFHKKGAVAAARQYISNTEKRSDPYAFYFVEGTMYNKPTLDRIEEDNKYKFSQEQRDYHMNNPSAAHLDGEHTVFGEIIEGFEVIPEITSVRRDSKDWPVKDIFIEKVELIK